MASVAVVLTGLSVIGPVGPGCDSTDGPQFRCYLAGLPATR